MCKEKAKKTLVPQTFIKIIFEDSDFLVINKPAGLVVNKAESVRGETVQDWAQKKLQITDHRLQITEFYKRAGVVHRLDKETSGVMVLAKNKQSFINLQKQFKERKVSKEYYALVHGVIKAVSSRINLPIKRSSFDRKRFHVSIKGRPALTFYKRLKIYQKGKQKFSYLKVKPFTGRTHQIRVHCHHLGHSLVSDPLYLGKKSLKKDLLWCPRLFLHSFKINFLHPKSGKKVSFKTPLPYDLKTALEKLEEN